MIAVIARHLSSPAIAERQACYCIDAAKNITVAAKPSAVRTASKPPPDLDPPAAVRIIARSRGAMTPERGTDVS